MESTMASAGSGLVARGARLIAKDQISNRSFLCSSGEE